MGIYDYCQVLGSRGRQLKIATNEIKKNSNPTILSNLEIWRSIDLDTGPWLQYWFWLLAKPLCYIFERWADIKPQRIAWQSFPWESRSVYVRKDVRSLLGVVWVSNCHDLVGFRVSEETRVQIGCVVWYVYRNSIFHTIHQIVKPLQLTSISICQRTIYSRVELNYGHSRDWALSGTLHIFCSWAQFSVLWNEPRLSIFWGSAGHNP